jgi:hypothetical protein
MPVQVGSGGGAGRALTGISAALADPAKPSIATAARATNVNRLFIAKAPSSIYCRRDAKFTGPPGRLTPHHREYRLRQTNRFLSIAPPFSNVRIWVFHFDLPPAVAPMSQLRRWATPSVRT